MNRDYTHIVLIVDRSGSMASVENDANGGIASLIQRQKECTGRASLAIYEFDTIIEKPIDVSDIKTCTGYKLVPRGGTALYDAVCTAIDETGVKLAKMPEAERPALVLVAIVTDGEENSSSKYTFEDMSKRVKTQEGVYNWKFSFLCSDPTTLKVAKSAGFSTVEAYNNLKTCQVYDSTGAKFTRMRSMVANDATLDVADLSNSYNTQELESMK